MDKTKEPGRFTQTKQRKKMLINSNGQNKRAWKE